MKFSNDEGEMIYLGMYYRTILAELLQNKNQGSQQIMREIQVTGILLWHLFSPSTWYEDKAG